MYFIREIEPEELPSWQRLRTKVYREKGFIKRRQLTKGLYVDGEELRSIHIAAFDVDGQMVGTFRMIMPDNNLLPVERDFGVRRNTDHGRISVELSGYAAAKGHREGIVSIGLIRYMFDLVAEHGVADIYAELEMPLLHLLNRYGLLFRIIGESKQIYNTENWPTLLRRSEIMSGLRAADRGRTYPILAPFFAQPFDGLISGATLVPHSTPPQEPSILTVA